MPTGRVVGIVLRNWKDYVASFAKDEVLHMFNEKNYCEKYFARSNFLFRFQQGSSTGKMGKVLVIPYDWRIPKIRISTGQVETLKEHRYCISCSYQNRRQVQNF